MPLSDDLRLAGVGALDARSVWPQVEPLVARAIARSDNRYEPSDVLDAVESRDMQLWVVLRGRDIVAAVVTQIAVYPRKKVAVILFAAGAAARSWPQFQNMLAAWARAAGCDGIEAWGRRGWHRITGWPMTQFVVARAV